MMALMAGAALAFGVVEAWSIATFGLSITALLVLWVIKGLIDRRLEISAPATALPLAVLILLGVLQGVTITESSGAVRSISLDAEATRLTTEVLIVLLAAFLLSANFLAKAPALTWFRNFLIFFGFALSVFGLIQRFTWNGKYYWFIEPSSPPPAPFGSFVNHNHFAGYVEMIAPIPVALILRRAVRGELAFLYGFAAALMGLAVVMSLSRGGMISLIAGLMFVVAFGFKPVSARELRVIRGGKRTGEQADRERPDFVPSLLVYRSPVSFNHVASRIGAMIVMLFTIGAGVWWVGADSVIRRIEKTDLTQNSAESGRRAETFYQSRGWIWRDTAAMIRDRWALGVGLGAFGTAYPIYNSQDGTIVVEQAHNDYLQVVADAGIIGAVIALCFICLVARDIVRASRHVSRAMSGTALGAAGGMFALFVHSLFDFNFQIPSNALLFLVLTSVVSHVAGEATRDRRLMESAGRHRRSASASAN
ncbi:MAG TPA: O-antigen ligase family protein [Blastocatellia bacterium]|nr:O-antigen ligase family protein [Blastocatellia bacterium]